MIDCHAHVVLEATMGAAGDLGPRLDDHGFHVGEWSLGGVRYRDTAFMDVERRLARMDANGIEHQVVSPNPLTLLTHADAQVANDFARAHNDALAELVAGRSRLSGVAQLPTQRIDAAVAELRRAVDLGLVGGAIGADLGIPLDDPALDPLWLASSELGAPLVLHPSPPGIDRPSQARVNRLDFELHVGFALEETVAVAELVLGGVLGRFPELSVLVPHGGGATIALAGRWDHAARTRQNSSSVPRDLRRLWFDNHLGSQAAIEALVATVGSDRIVLGTNCAGWDDTGVELHGLDPTELTANARRLFPRLPGHD